MPWECREHFPCHWLQRNLLVSDHGMCLTHWGRLIHICVGELTIIVSDNGLSPGRRQAITWTNVGILLIGPLGTNFSEISIEIHTFAFKQIHLKMSSGKWRPFCRGLNVLMHMPCCMSGSLTHGDGGNVAGIRGACATRNFMYLARGP